jgi:hypothetical protein
MKKPLKNLSTQDAITALLSANQIEGDFINYYRSFGEWLAYDDDECKTLSLSDTKMVKFLKKIGDFENAIAVTKKQPNKATIKIGTWVQDFIDIDPEGMETVEFETWASDGETGLETEAQKVLKNLGYTNFSWQDICLASCNKGKRRIDIYVDLDITK